MIKVPDVTLIAIDCTDRIRGTIEALNTCVKSMEFGDVVLLRHEKPNDLPSFITHKEIKEIKNIDAYNSFIFLELYKYFDTSHVLLCQDHAYIINPEMWDDEWLKWDYIGSPWAIVPNAYTANNGERSRVGNGGFSIRSKKICRLPSEKGWGLREERGFKNEDGQICCYWKKEMLIEGVKYAPLEVAVKFGYEKPMEENNYGNVKAFGFHRNLPNLGL